MKLFPAVIGIALALSTTLVFASPCAPTKDDTARVGKAFKDYDAKMKGLDIALQVKNASGDDKLIVLQQMFDATRSLQEVSLSLPKAYCDLAKATVNVLFSAVSSGYQNDERRAILLITTEQIASSLGVALSQKQSALVIATAKPLVEKAVKALDEAVAAKNLDRIARAYDDLKPFANTVLGKVFKVSEKLRAAEAAYNAISEAEVQPKQSK